MPQHDILGYGQGRNQHKVLMHHTNMQPDSIAWPRDVRNLAIDQDFTTIGVNQSIEDIHQGSFAGSVFPNQCMNLTLTHLEIDMVVGNDTGPCFGKVASRVVRLGLLGLKSAKGMRSPSPNPNMRQAPAVPRGVYLPKIMAARAI